MPDLQHIQNVLRNNYLIRFTKIEFFRDGGSLSYIIFSENKQFFLRIIRPVLMSTALQSIDIHLYLLTKDFSVPKIIFTKDKAPYFSFDEQNGKHMYVLYEFIHGSDSNPVEDAEKVGSVVGEFHTIMQGYDGVLSKRGKHFFIDRYIEILKKKQYPKKKINAFKEYGDALWDKVKHLPNGYCHGDLYCGNVYITPTDEVYILDFDTSCNAFPMYDIALFCNATNYFDYDESNYDKSKRILESFLKGYLTQHSLAKAEITLFFDLIAISHFQLQATIMEIYGLDCVDEKFLDKQFDWVMSWRKQCEQEKLKSFLL